MFNEVDHIAIAVTNLEEALVLYHDILGFQVKEIEEVSEQGVKVAKLMIGCNIIELITPLSESSPIAKFLDKHGPGLHHIALNTDNIEDTMQNLKTKGLQFVGDTITRGASGARIIFIHPKATLNVLFEIITTHEKNKV